MLHLIILSISSILLIIIINLALKIYKSRTCHLNKLPGPKPASLILGSSLDIFRHSFIVPATKWWKQAGYETSMMYYIGPFGSKNLIILDADIVQEILTSPSYKAGGGGGVGNKSRAPQPRIIRKRHFMKHTMGDSLLSLDGADWYRHRKILQPSFNLKSLKESLSACVSRLVPVLIESWTNCRGAEIDVAHHLSALTLDIIGIVGFSHNFNVMEEVKNWSLEHRRRKDNKESDGDGGGDDDDDGLPYQTTTTTTPGLSNRFINAFQTSMQPNVPRLIARQTGLTSLYHLIDVSNRRVGKIVNDYADAIVKDAHHKMKQLVHSNDDDDTSTTGKDEIIAPRSILNHLMMAAAASSSSSTDPSFKRPRESFSDRELRDEIKGFILAGHETTSTWMYWCLYALVTYPKVQKLVYEDIVKMAPPEDDGGRHVIALETIERHMPYFNAFVTEVLRFYCPIVQNPMVVNKKNGVTLGGGVNVPDGTRLVISPYLLHRHPKYWDNPDEFLPERWLSNDDDDGDTKPYKHPCAFIPFSAGHRTCIGREFATIELKLVMAPLIRALGVTLAPSQRDVKFRARGVMFLKNDPRLKVCVRAR